ncbi:MAG: hypothetical protein FD160_1283 [Caulobacteraceae bacterium]|nr:MAG: hypothetical protein FD160_1283 [Caulobacteraceae bacterium]
MMILTAVIVVAGLFSIVGALRRTAKRPAPGADGGPMLGGLPHGRRGEGRRDDDSDDGDGGGDGGD